MLYKVTAIIRSDDLERVENELQRAHVRGITVTQAKGYGEHKNFFAGDWMQPLVRIDIFTSRAEEISKVIVDCVHTGQPGDGIVAVMPVEKVIRIRERREVTDGEH